MFNDARPGTLSWVHFGDLHITTEGERNYQHFAALIDQVNTHLAGQIDFCLLPGDNADDGIEPQYRLVRSALDKLAIPLHILPGDHDRKQGDLHAFYSVLGAPSLPNAVSIGGYRCLFLDIVSPGRGGPDFRLGAEQLLWLEQELAEAKKSGEQRVIFMHAYPADLKADTPTLLRLIRAYGVKAVDMGHTHYNELANDGHTIFATTRSTGQIEEGPVGFSIMTLDQGVVSWRFKPLDTPWPFVLITSPADHRLATESDQPQHDVRGRVTVAARAWSADGIAGCRCRINDGSWVSMNATSTGSHWIQTCAAPEQPFVLTVEAKDNAGHVDTDTIRVTEKSYRPTDRIADGSDADTIGAWPERHILGTQLGPNRNGRRW
jgi:3',5'-cyclic-AMP phosphodiesterase